MSFARFSCICPDGFEGPRCEQYKISLDGSGWAWFNPIQSCQVDYISVQFMTTSDTGLLLYNGPMEAVTNGKNGILVFEFKHCLWWFSF